MKYPSLLLALFLVAFAAIALCSCEGFNIDKASKIADIALTAGVLSGDINPADAQLAYGLKTIVLDPAVTPTDKGAAVVDLALTKAVERGSIKPEEADAVRQIGVVILEEPEGPVEDAPPPASPDLGMRWQDIRRSSPLDDIEGPTLSPPDTDVSPVPFGYGLVAWSRGL